MPLSRAYAIDNERISQSSPLRRRRIQTDVQSTARAPPPSKAAEVVEQSKRAEVKEPSKPSKAKKQAGSGGWPLAIWLYEDQGDCLSCMPHAYAKHVL